MDSCINFNTAYGDISIIGNDVEIIRGYSKKTAQDIIRLFKTNERDYELDASYGLDLDRFIGKAISDLLAVEIKNSIEDTLIKNEIIKDLSNLQILYMIIENTINFRIMLPGIDSITVDFLQEKGFEIEWIKFFYHKIKMKF